MKYMKHLPLQGAHNVRDLGGYPTADGHATRWGVLYRSDALGDLCAADWEILCDRNVRTVIDLRSQSETKQVKIVPPSGVEYFHFSLMKDLDVGKLASGREKFLESMVLNYEKTLFENLRCAVDILRVILEKAENGAVLFFCSAGKDRTGIVAALLLYLCGVLREDIIADYIVSSTYNENGINRRMESLPPEVASSIPDMEALKKCLASNPETIRALLDAFEARDIRRCLTENGFDENAQRALVRAFTAD